MFQDLKKYVTVVAIVFIYACGTPQGNSEYLGTWSAHWETDPAGYPGISKELDFTMSGKFMFEEDSITIEGYGFKGCIFTEDTIHHKLIWQISNDSLKLFNDPDTPGLVYKIIESGKGKIKLQLEDIYVTLSK